MATGLAAGLVTLVGFGLVPVLRIRRVPVMRVLQRGQAAPGAVGDRVRGAGAGRRSRR
ncbi:MAG: hypothetical protein U5K43_00465 [Halofilum sp. (in: g-proteobacteria)]|nr:hypothetical protein [Halofilum sp. (in: g-proteobacteria)]